MNIYEKVKWYYLGEVAEMVEDYDDTADAVLMPMLGMIFGAASLHAAVSLAGDSLLTALAVAVPLGILGAACAVFVCVSVGASVVYANQPTELPPEAEVVADGR